MSSLQQTLMVWGLNMGHIIQMTCKIQTTISGSKAYPNKNIPIIHPWLLINHTDITFSCMWVTWLIIRPVRWNNRSHHQKILNPIKVNSFVSKSFALSFAIGKSVRKWLRIWVDVLLACGLRIRVKTIGEFLHFIQHYVFHCAVPFCEYCTHL